MSEIRQDPTTGEWVIIAKERAKRPHDLARHKPNPDLPEFLSSCPFCPGNEAMTPAELLAYRDEKTHRWQVRVFNNRFPALTREGSTARRIEENLFLSMDGVGVHEVIVEAPKHNKTLALMEDSEVASVLFAYQARYNTVSQLPFVKSIILFKNHGPSAGTSIEHPHSQLMATPIVPGYIKKQCEVAISYYNDTGRCLYSDLADQELRTGTRIVMETDQFVVFHPFASHRPFETWIMPRVHQACFGDVSTANLEDLAHVLRVTLLGLYRGLNNPDFNYVIDSVLPGEGGDYYLWHLRIVPRLTETAGFELGSGIYINTALPEETAQFMRELKIE